jgi:hypothetical protein
MATVLARAALMPSTVVTVTITLSIAAPEAAAVTVTVTVAVAVTVASRANEIWVWVRLSLPSTHTALYPPHPHPHACPYSRTPQTPAMNTTSALAVQDPRSTRRRQARTSLRHEHTMRISDPKFFILEDINGARKVKKKKRGKKGEKRRKRNFTLWRT